MHIFGRAAAEGGVRANFNVFAAGKLRQLFKNTTTTTTVASRRIQVSINMNIFYQPSSINLKEISYSVQKFNNNFFKNSWNL